MLNPEDVEIHQWNWAKGEDLAYLMGYTDKPDAYQVLAVCYDGTVETLMHWSLNKLRTQIPEKWAHKILSVDDAIQLVPSVNPLTIFDKDKPLAEFKPGFDDC